MKIVVFGASGRLGCTLIPYLKSCGHNVFYDFIDESTNFRVDLCEYEDLGRILDLHNPEIIINLAAFTDVDQCEDKPILAYLVNVKIVENIVKWIKLNNNCYLIQLSSDHLYNGSGPHKEYNHTLTNYYSYSKFMGELVASQVSSTILRTNFIGRSKCKVRRCMTDWLMDSIINQKPFAVFDDIFFSPLSLNTLSEQIEMIVRNQIPGTYNLGSKNGLSKAELAYFFVDLLDLKAEFMRRNNSTSIKLRSYRPKDMRMDSSLFEKTFGVKLPTLKNELIKLKPLYEHYPR
mgnify:CR=1 FL=1|tara:strand:- start:181 stop:1050 length:870 start_codon:yes stop_codon:yes gene_type:complete